MTFRVGSVGYLNARPLTDHLDPNRCEVVTGHPSEIARLLAKGQVDMALVPVAAVLSDGDYRVLGEVCIGAEGPVHSVVLVAETPLESWTQVVLDGVSRTSAVLSQLLLKHGPLSERVTPSLRVTHSPPGQALAQAGGTVAALVIGDVARELPARFSVRIDLAEAWTAWTGLPFVFAVWAGRPGVDSALCDHLKVAARAGLRARDATYTGSDLQYLTTSIRYAFDDRALVGLRRFAALATQAGLVTSEQVRFFDPPVRTVLRAPDIDTWLADVAAGKRLPTHAYCALAENARIADLSTAVSMISPPAAIDVEVVRELTTQDAAQVLAEAQELAAFGGTAVHLLGQGVVDIDHWVALIQAAAQSGLRVRAGTLADLLALSLPFEQVLARFAQAGALGWVGVQGVCLTGSWRAKHGQLPADDWLAALAKASQVLGVTLGLQVGAGERPAERVAHWVRLREALDQGLVATGVHTALVTGLGASGTAHDWLVATALAKFMFPDVATHQVAWRPGLVGVAQSAFELGANALGPVVLPDARATWESTIRDVHRNLTACGLRAAWPVDSPLASLVQSSNRIHR